MHITSESMHITGVSMHITGVSMHITGGAMHITGEGGITITADVHSIAAGQPVRLELVTFCILSGHSGHYGAAAPVVLLFMRIHCTQLIGRGP